MTQKQAGETSRPKGAGEDLLAHKHFPEEHRRQLHSTGPLERLNKETVNLTGHYPGGRPLRREPVAAIVRRHGYSASHASATTSA